jgi:deoxyguanosine kinase
MIIEGAIGVGKTTLARMLSAHFASGLLLEVFEENPFLARFYQDRARYAFQTQMFFLLSRYRQQQKQVEQYLGQGALISDYMFDKDWLFAQLNLSGDEWDVYQQIHAALASQIPGPDLIVYLQADTDVLMARITQRDRPYERDMDRDYIDELRQAYERFLPTQASVPVLTINTNHLNIVTNADDFQFIASQIQDAIGAELLPQQPHEPQIQLQERDTLAEGRPLADYQRFHSELDRRKGFDADIYFNYLCLSEEMGELGSILAQLWREEMMLSTAGQTQVETRRTAIQKHKKELGSELADCMAYLLKLANYAGVNLEDAYLQKMRQNRKRSWRRESSEKLGRQPAL